jgi:hypothetical protein
MEERNILWGELVGGLLIVGCSVALVLTLWQNLQALPYFPFLLFGVLTAALFGAGQYTLHHWKLASTSRGLLLISLLLVPLNLLVLADPSARGRAPDLPWLDALIGAGAVALFTLLVRAAGRDLIGTGVLPGPVDRRWLLALAVAGAAGTQLVTPHLLDHPDGGPVPARLLALAALPAACYLLACGAVLGGLTLYGRRTQRLHAGQAHALFAFVGLAAFALLAAFGYLLTRLEGPLLPGLHALALPLLLAGVPALAGGLLVQREMREAEAAGPRTAGTAMAVAGLIVLCAGLALAWPAPWPLLTGVGITAAVLVLAAFAGRFPWAHAGAVPCAALAFLLGYHLAAGSLPIPPGGDPAAGLTRLLFGAESGAVLAVLAAGLAGLASWLCRPGWRIHALALGRGAVGVGAAALLLVTAHGPERPLTAALVHGVCTLAGLAASLRWRGAVLPHAAGAMLVPGTLWALWGLCPEQHEVWGLTLALEALALVLASVALRRQEDLSRALERVALLGGALALPLTLSAGNFPSQPLHTFTALALSGGALVLALARRDAGWFTGFQTGLAVTVVCAITAWTPSDWLAEMGRWQVYGLGLALLGLGLVALRRSMESTDRLRDLWPGTWPGLDRLLLGGLVVGQLLLAGAGALDGVFREWSSVTLGAHAHGPAGWLLLGVLAVALGVVLRAPAREDAPVRAAAVLGLVLLGISVPQLWAGLHGADRAGASALRWGLAACFLAGSVLVWMRRLLGQRAEALGFAAPPTTVAVQAVLAGVAGVVVVLTAILAQLGFAGAVLPGPLPESLFARMGAVSSSIGPLVLVLLGLAGSAVRERSPGYALAAGLLAVVSTMGGYALGVVQAGGVLHEGQVVFIGLLGCQVSAGAGLTWLAGRRRVGAGPLLAVQAWLGLAGVCFPALALVPLLLAEPGSFPLRFQVLGGGVGWLALMLSAAAAWWYAAVSRPRDRIHVLGLTGLTAGVLAASFARAWDTPAAWTSYHVLAAFWSWLAVAVLVAGWLLPEATRRWPVLFPARRVRGWLVGLSTALVLVAVRGGWDDLAQTLVPTLAALSACLLATSAALWFRRPGLVYLSGLLCTLSGVLVWVGHGPDTISSLLFTVIIALGLASAFWSVVEQRWPIVSFAHLGTPLTVLLLAGVVGTALLQSATGAPPWSLGWFAWAALAAVGLAVTAAVRDRHDRLALPGLYAFGLTGTGLALLALPLSSAWLLCAGALALGAYVSLTGAVAALACRGQEKPRGLRPPLNEDRRARNEREWSWFLPAKVVAGSVVVVLAFGVALALPRLWQRLTGPLAVLLLVPAGLFLALVAPGGWPRNLRMASAALGALALALVAWAVPDPAGSIPWLHRNAWLLPALTVAALVALEAQPRWRDAGRLGLVLGGLAVALVPVLLGQMFPLFDPLMRRTPLGGPGSAAVALAILTLLATALRLALRPDRDPLALAEGRRTAYVYLAEVLLVLLFAHVRLNIPELFLGPLAKYWTLVVMTLAFVGVGLGEWFERRGLRVLAVPLARTGVFLPLIPLLSFWARPPAALLAFAADNAPGLRPFLTYLEKLPWNFDAHALLWFLASGLYALLAMARRSFRWALAAALAANFGLWALLLHTGIGFLAHPQAWVIPLALIILVAEYLNRHHLSAEAGQALRYLGISLIYVASTADLFLAGLGNSVWLPIVLAGLCVTGVLAGILLRVRAFLFLGTGFLLVDVLTMIYHAAVDRAHTWLWWASGIVLGVAILTLFAVFEKRRNDVLRLLEDLRRWD